MINSCLLININSKSSQMKGNFTEEANKKMGKANNK